MKTLTREDINLRKLDYYFKTSLRLLDPPMGIIPPKISEYETYAHIVDVSKPYRPHNDYAGHYLDFIYSIVNRSLLEWDPEKKIDRVGIFLSGGIDSALLLKYTSAVLGSEHVRAYNLTWGEDKDETEYAKAVCDFCDVKLVQNFMPYEVVPKLIKESCLLMRAPSWCPQVLYMAKVLEQDGTNKAFIGLGLDALTGGEQNLWAVQNSQNEFELKETKTLDLQRDYIWGNVYNCHGRVDLKMPYLKFPDAVDWMRGLPIHHKVEGRITKLRLRKEIEKFSVLPPINRDYGKIVGTKRGFGPNWESYFQHGYREFAHEHDPANLGFNMSQFPTYKVWKSSFWYELTHSSFYFFLELLDEGAFTVEE
jgi:asparagine synthetase B (glutamine-hydrolysing)